MNLVYLFRRLVFAQVLLGIAAFCIAEHNPRMMLIAGTVGALSWYVVEGPTGKPLPRWLINIGSLGAVMFLVLDLRYQSGRPLKVLIAMGHFTMWLQILELYAKKTNRDYGLILVLSLLQMVGASVLSASIVFGLLLAAYCVLSLFTVLLFSLKTTSDQVMDNNQAQVPRSVTVARPDVVVGRGHRLQFRATAGLIGALCAAIAVLVFLLLPRTSRSTEMRALPQALADGVGFAELVNLGTPPGPPTSTDVVFNVTISREGRNMGGDGASFLMRGAALDHYDSHRHIWSRSAQVQRLDRELALRREGVHLMTLPTDTPMLDAEVTLRGSRSRVLFTLYPTSHLDSVSFPRVSYNPIDRQLSAPVSANGPMRYRMQAPALARQALAEWSPGALQPEEGLSWDAPSLMLQAALVSTYARGWNEEEVEPIRALTLAVLRDAGVDRDVSAAFDPRDEQIAKVLVNYLSNTSNFRYSLENPQLDADADPLADFLFERKQGHCELFASALAAMARSIGLRARVVTGYRATEYNSIGGYYVVRPANAHAWTEIDISGRGWQTFDATPAGAVEDEHRVHRNWLTSISELYDYLEFNWLGSVVTYDKETREALLGDIEDSIKDAVEDEDSLLGRAALWIKDVGAIWRIDRLSLLLMGGIMVILIVAVGATLRSLLARRRRVLALQLARLPRRQRRELSRRLRFYLDMLELLEQRGYHRPPWQSPQSFAQKLAAEHPRRFDPVVALTEHFYEIRFGHREMDDARQSKIRSGLRELEDNLATRA